MRQEGALELELLEEPLVFAGLVSLLQEHPCAVSCDLPLWGLLQRVLVESRLGEVNVHGVTGGHHVVVVGNLQQEGSLFKSGDCDTKKIATRAATI